VVPLAGEHHAAHRKAANGADECSYDAERDREPGGKL
jgi:hypothetical protein